MYKVIKDFKCRHHDFKVFKKDEEYKGKNAQHTKKLLDEGYIKKVEKADKK